MFLTGLYLSVVNDKVSSTIVSTATINVRYCCSSGIVSDDHLSAGDNGKPGGRYSM
ncbi:hypothetical protein OAU10_02210 [Saprospiraceae bacterium]|nr:hypothetical protein [Saprospiraceae bacterium]MDC3210294.1 hypothetical protein [Saprospiraceae bacterium]